MGEAKDETIADSPARRRRVTAARERAEATAERYEITGEIARGGLGVIQAAIDKQLGRPVAIKRLLLPSGAGLARFRREVEITARLQHPNIIPVHESGTWSDGEPFFAMKLVDGRPLSEVIGEATNLGERLALLPHVIAVADAIAYAHTEDVIHRDLKPSNVLVGPFGETVVIDWGLAKSLSEDPPSDPTESLSYQVRPARGAFETTDGSVLGTPGYMAPEQLAGNTGDPRTDVYALGAILYHLLSGKRAFFDVDRSKLLESLADEEPEPLDVLAPEAPADLIAIVEKAMARTPGDRYANAGEMAEELRRFSTGRLVGARRYTALELFARFVGRHRGIIATSAVAFVALVGLAIWSVGNIREERAVAERNAANYHRAKTIAEQRVDRLILDEARVLLDLDPTMALARLKGLSVIPEGAATVAADAEERGVARRVLAGHTGVVRAMAMSADGAQIASGGDDGAVFLWDAHTGERHLLGKHRDRVSAIRLSADGKTAISASYDQTLALWPLAGGEAKILRGHEGAISDLAVAGDAIAAASGDTGRVGVWRGDDRPVFYKIPRARSAMVALSADGAWLAAAGFGKSAMAWHLPDGRSIALADGVEVTALALARGGLVTGDGTGAVRLWSLESAAAKTLATLDGAITALAIAGDRIAAGDMGGEVAILDPDDAPRVLGRHNERVTSLRFGVGGERLVSASWDRTARVWDLASGEARVLSGHSDVVGAVAVAGADVVTASWDGTLRQWRIASPVRRVLRGHGIGVKTVALSRGLLASGGHDNTVRLWALDGGPTIIARGHTDHVYEVAFSPDGSIVASSSDDRTVRLWNRDGSERAVLRGHTADVERLAFSPDGSLLASASEDDTARIWRVGTGDVVRVAEHRGDVTGLAFSPDGARLATSSRDGAIRLWPIAGGPPQIIARHQGDARDVAWSADGRAVVSVGDDATLRAWRPATGSAVIATDLGGAHSIAIAPAGDRVAVVGSSRTGWLCRLDGAGCARLVGHRGPITAVAYAPDGRFVATASADYTARIWDADTAESRVLRGHTASVFGVAFSADSRWLATGSADTTVRLWPVVGPPAPSDLHRWLDAVTEAVFPEG